MAADFWPDGPVFQEANSYRADSDSNRHGLGSSSPLQVPRARREHGGPLWDQDELILWERSRLELPILKRHNFKSSRGINSTLYNNSYDFDWCYNA